MQIVVLGVVKPEMAMNFGSKEVEPRLMRGLSHTLFLGTVKNSPVYVLDQKCPCEFA